MWYFHTLQIDSMHTDFSKDTVHGNTKGTCKMPCAMHVYHQVDGAEQACKAVYMQHANRLYLQIKKVGQLCLSPDEKESQLSYLQMRRVSQQRQVHPLASNGWPVI